jgi:hypothetical protein
MSLPLLGVRDLEGGVGLEDGDGNAIAVEGLGEISSVSTAAPNHSSSSTGFRGVVTRSVRMKRVWWEVTASASSYALLRASECNFASAQKSPKHVNQRCSGPQYNATVANYERDRLHGRGNTRRANTSISKAIQSLPQAQPRADSDLLVQLKCM